MDSKTIKSSLKQAKEAIRSNEIETALKLCKAVLKEDRNNYLGLVLFGAALQESEQKDQAPNAYRKAVELSPEQPLAWQGLANFYEKEDSNKNAEYLAPVYKQLLQLESDSAKWFDIVNKLQGIVNKFSSDDFMVEMVAEYKKVEDNNKSEAIRKVILQYLSYVYDIPEKYSSLYEEFFTQSPSELDSNQRQLYIKLLYNQNKYQELLAFAENISNTCDDARVIELICRVCSEQFVENRSDVVEWCKKLLQYVTKLVELEKDNVYALMAQGTYHMAQNAFLEARDCLQQYVSANPSAYHAVVLLAEAYTQLLCRDKAMQYVKMSVELRPEHPAALGVLAKVLSTSEREKDWPRAVTLASQVLKNHQSPLAAEALCETHLRLKQWSDLSSAVTHLSHAPGLAALYQLETQVEGGDLLPLLLDNTPDCPEAWYRLGCLHQNKGDLQLACTAFLKCAKLAPHWYTAYLQLGHIYAQDTTMMDKARRCYQRALVLNPAHVPTQRALSDAYRALGDAKSNLELLQSVCQTGEGRWAWPRLGLQHSDLGDTTAAISCLRTALKSDPDDSHLWEALADAYLARGANGSALKSYQRVLDLRPGAFYPALKIATIKQITDLPHESLLEFRELVRERPTSILALKGLCDTCLCLAKDFLRQRLLGLARDRLQEGLDAMGSAIQERPDIACLWQLAAECMTTVAILPGSWNSLSLPEVLSPKVKTLQGLQLLELGARFFCRSLKLIKNANTARVWHCLALNYRYQAMLTPVGTDDRKTLCQKASAAVREAVKCNPRGWEHWNLLGVIAALPEVKNYRLAQHAFIKATMADESVAVPWANLGALYLTLGRAQLANMAFGAGQRTDPEYCPSWLGQALIAEDVKHQETNELFRHTTQLGFNAESCVGYAEHVCRILQNREYKKDRNSMYFIEKMHAVPLAVDVLTWATDEVENDACGLNMLGCLLERQGLYGPAVQALSRAVKHVSADHKDKVMANFARVLLKAGKTEDAVQVYRGIGKFDIHSQCGLSLALYKGKQYQEAYEAYEAALNWWAADDETKAHLHVALAAVVYKLAGPDKAKALLLQGNQLKPQSVYGLFAACSLGMLKGDMELSKLMLKEMLKYQNEEHYTSHVALFQAYIKFIQGDVAGSVSSMSKALHQQPQQPALWLHLTLLILQKHSVSADPLRRLSGAARCAQTAITLGHSYMDVSKVMALVSLSYLQGGDVPRALVASKRAVHLYPHIGEAWAVLAASCCAARLDTPLRPIISHARQNTELERPLAKWMSNFERKLAISASS
ncbi:tetratricopeptide repeat protein 37-like [Macrosteles quadrilineatus]|uniref:tetratricopeptide repeat protein 37-like n=1 Tax=Macrosteles quadrilineatus TaxID=74068 RepID=UPI0023E2C18D|nr:tetratricopeptide repeat protein 37-like [Macrosteles quadrilineatus]